MRSNKKIHTGNALQAIVLLLFICNYSVQAQKLVAQVAKTKVAVGEVFQIAFSINANCSNFRAPGLSDFDVYSGPNQSTSMQIVNGSVSQSITLSYFIAPRKEGKLTIGPASVQVNGKKIESNSIVVEVYKGNAAANPNNANNNRNNSNQREEDPEYASAVSNEDLFVRTYISKKSCYLGEQVVVTQKVYSRLTLRGFQNCKLPAYNGFWSQEEDRTKQITLQTENLDGINYYVANFNTTYLFPQRTGKLTIEPIEIDCVVRQRSNRQPQSVFDQFFGNGGYQDVVMKIKSKPVSVDVQALPETNKPENFSGAVGSFSYKAEMDKSSVKANEAINLKITLHGTGNVKLIDAPKINFPEGFETYDPKLNESVSVNGGVSGSKTYDYLIIPRQPGEFVIKDLNFSYFDPAKKQYITIPTPEFKISVKPGEAGASTGAQVYSQKHKVEQADNDIRYIKTGDLDLKPKDDEFFSSWKHYALVALSVFLFSGVVMARQRYIKANSNIRLVKERQAAKIARKQLVAANKLMQANKKDEFYNEIFIALNRYIGDKLNIPVADLSKESIQKNLTAKNVNNETVNKFIQALNDCEIAKYAPGTISADLNTVYNNTIELISTVEDELKA